jgi:hypothetical protein
MPRNFSTVDVDPPLVVLAVHANREPEACDVPLNEKVDLSLTAALEALHASAVVATVCADFS